MTEPKTKASADRSQADRFQVVDRRRMPFVMVSWEFLDQKLRRLSGAGWKVYAALLRHADASGRCWPGQERLGELAGLTRETVNIQLGLLKSPVAEGGLGLIRVAEERGRLVYELLDLSEILTGGDGISNPPGPKVTENLTGAVKNSNKGCEKNPAGAVRKSHPNKIHENQNHEPEGEGEHAAAGATGASTGPAEGAQGQRPQDTPEAGTGMPDIAPGDSLRGTFIGARFMPSVRSEQVAYAEAQLHFGQDVNPRLVRRWMFGAAADVDPSDLAAFEARLGGEVAEFRNYWESQPRTARSKKLDWQKTFQNALKMKAARERLLSLVMLQRRGEFAAKGENTPGSGQGGRQVIGQGQRAKSPAAEFYGRARTNPKGRDQ